MLRSFTLQDQLSFARLSGDFNPMHVDPVAARRLMFGRPVVHGIHALIWAIDTLLSQLEKSGDVTTPVGIGSLKSSFRSPILVNEPIELTVTSSKQGKWKLSVSNKDVLLASTTLMFATKDAVSVVIASQIPEQRACRELGANDLSNVRGQLPLLLQTQLAAELFPTAIRLLANDQFATLLAATRLVGMEAPGLHSLFTGLELTRSNDAPKSGFTYAAEEFDERFSMLTLGIQSADLTGKISAALRPAPTAQATIADLRQLVAPGEFAGQRVLVIGGSRGLGEVVVKALIAGGAAVRFTYHKGVADAQRIVTEVIAAGASTACFAYDVSTDAARLPELISGWSPTAFFYFATPYIGSSLVGRFSAEMFSSFSRCYVEDFLAAFNAVRKHSSALAQVFYPSSSTVEDMPPNLIEYFTAKAAGEKLCEFLQKVNPEIRFMIPRLPRLATDQTASLIPAESADPAIEMLQLLRQMNFGAEKVVQNEH